MNAELEPIDAARRIVLDEEPAARCAFLSASVLGAARTSTSDLDLVVVRPDGARPLHRVFRRYGWPAEVFLLDEAELRGHWAKDRRTRTPVLMRLVGDGVSVGRDDRLAEALTRAARQLLVAGPPPLGEAERDRRRYVLSDLLDDLVDAREPLERQYISNAVLRHTAELVLLTHGRWLGEDKWLGRVLTAYDAGLAGELARAHAVAVGGEAGPLAELALRVLDGVGGRLPATHR